ncbi:hypothetical protein GCM10025788_10710 [Serinicoccus chungangensis]
MSQQGGHRCDGRGTHRVGSVTPVAPDRTPATKDSTRPLVGTFGLILAVVLLFASSLQWPRIARGDADWRVWLMAACLLVQGGTMIVVDGRERKSRRAKQVGHNLEEPSS